MDIKEFVEQQGEFLKAIDIIDGSIAVVAAEAKVVHNEKFDTDRLHIPVKLNGKDYIFDCSKTNARTISSSIGEDTTSWIGKQIVLEKYKTKTSEGVMTLAINVKEVKA